MNTFVHTLDTVYEQVIGITIRCITAVQNAYGYGLPRSHDGAETVDLIEETVSQESDVEEVGTFRRLDDILRAQAIARHKVEAEKNVIMYASTARVPFYKDPTIEFDSQIGEIPYGEMVMMLEARGRFFRVVWKAEEGWILKDDLVDRGVEVYPEFAIGEENSVDSVNTARVRAILNDEFGVGRSEFPLQAGEYVLYKLWRKGIRISWPETRPRVPGLWHKILKGLDNVYMSVTPRVGAVMEYTIDGDIGHLAYVEAVFPDDTITISEANYPDRGMYNERVLTREEWRELRPVFIEVK